MDFQRLKHTIRLWTIPGSAKRAAYMRDHGLLKEVGSNVSIMDRKVPLYGNLIKLHNNVHLASNVSFVTHDITHVMINGRKCPRVGVDTVHEKLGCIEICDNVFVGAGVRILYNTRIGENVVIAAGSVVTKDVPSGSVAAGVPARVIGSFDDYVAKRQAEEPYPEEPILGRSVGAKLEEYLWKQFEESRT